MPSNFDFNFDFNKESGRGRASLMFSTLHRRIPKQQIRSLSASLALHGLLLALLLHAPGATVISPALTLAGENGPSITPLYWPGQATAAHSEPNSKSSAERTRHRKVSDARLTWNHAKEKRTDPPDAALTETAAAANASSATSASPTPPAGSRYGSLYSGSLGHEVRPALPVLSTEPVVSPADLVGGIEGSVVVEITIDEKGNIVDKVVLHGLRPAIDAKVLAALETWHFSPATRDGVAIPSKQDVYYHFKPN
jgi:TonB family protein